VSLAEAADPIFHSQDAVKRALPHALQVADRYHLVQNLREHLQRFLDRKPTWLPFVEETSLKGTGGGSAGGTGLPCALSPGPSEPVSLLGIDDWSFRRGRQFGTILVNLATHEIIDLLPDRKTETAQSWMKGHPEIDVVSRDRGEEYAAVQMEAVHCRFRNKYLPLFGPYCWKKWLFR